MALIPRIDSVAFDPNRILYEKILEEGENGEMIMFYRCSSDPNLIYFALSFSQVGQGFCDYRRSSQLSNGTVFEYMPRINGLRLGDYSIITQLAAPDSKRMMTVGSSIKLGEYEKTYTEVALSSADQNLFSEQGDDNTQGLGWKVGLQSEGRQSRIFKGYTIKGETVFEYNSPNFNFINRFRYIEFDRDWGLTQANLEEVAAERFFRAGLGFEKDNLNRIIYSIYTWNRENVLNGSQHTSN